MHVFSIAKRLWHIATGNTRAISVRMALLKAHYREQCRLRPDASWQQFPHDIPLIDP